MLDEIRAGNVATVIIKDQNINKLKESQTKGASGELPAPYGKYQNVFLTESEYAELKQEYPDSLERLIEEMSRYIASSGNDYICIASGQCGQR